MIRKALRGNLIGLVGCVVLIAPVTALAQKAADHDADVRHAHEDHGGHGHVVPEPDRQIRTDCTFGWLLADAPRVTVAVAASDVVTVCNPPVLRPTGRDPPFESSPRAPPVH